MSSGQERTAGGVRFRPADDATLVLLAATLLCMYPALTTSFERPDFLAVAAAAGGILCLGAILARAPQAAWGVLVLALLIGLGARLEFAPFDASDVMTATHEALTTLFGGANPYTHDYLTTLPKHSIFPYLPGELAFYALADPLVPAWLGPPDRLAGMLVLLLIASLAFVTGPVRAALFTALYATSRMAIQNSADGGNDTALALLTCGAVSVGAWAWACRPPALRSALYACSACLLGWAVCFKMLAWLIAPFAARWLLTTSPHRKRDALLLAGTALGPALAFFLWNPLGMLLNVAAAPAFHPNIWGLNVWTLGFQLGSVPTWDGTIPAVMLATAVAGGVFAFRFGGADLGKSVAAGCLWLLAVVVVSRWTTSSYYTYPLTVLALAAPLTGRLPEASRDAGAKFLGDTAAA